MREPCEAKSLPGVVTRSNRKPVIYTDLQRSPESCRMLDVCPATPFHSDASEADQTRTNTKQKPQVIEVHDNYFEMELLYIANGSLVSDFYGPI